MNSQLKLYSLETPNFIYNIGPTSGFIGSAPVIALPRFSIRKEITYMYLTARGAAFAQARGFITTELTAEEEQFINQSKDDKCNSQH